MVWARTSSKIINALPLSGLFLSVSAKMTQNGHEGKGFSGREHPGHGMLTVAPANMLEIFLRAVLSVMDQEIGVSGEQGA
jgi:hypothetical protein